jgi:hypothetical protein
MTFILRSILITSLFINQISFAFAQGDPPSIGNLLKDVLSQDHEYNTYKYIKNNEAKVCIDGEERSIENQTDKGLFTKAWGLNCTVITTSQLCKDVDKSDLHNCNEPLNEFSISNSLSNVKACYNGIKKSWEEWFQFIEQVAQYTFNKNERSKTNDKISKAYNSFKNYLAIEVTKHSDKYNVGQEEAFRAVTYSLLKKAVSGIKKMLEKAVPQIGCFNQAAKTQFKCRVFAEFFAEPLVMFKFVKIGAKALKGTKVASLIKISKKSKIVSKGKKFAATKPKVLKSIKKEDILKSDELLDSSSDFSKSLSEIRKDVSLEYNKQKKIYDEHPNTYSKSEAIKASELKKIKENILSDRSMEINRLNHKIKMALEKEGFETEMISSGKGFGINALRLKKSETLTNTQARKIARYQDRFKTEDVTFDIAHNLHINSNGFSVNRRIDLGVKGVDEILGKNDLGQLAKHEFTHAAFKNKRDLGVDSIYHSSYKATGKRKLNQVGFYDEYMSAEELYTFSNQSLWRLETLIKEVEEKGFYVSKKYIHAELDLILNDMKSLNKITDQSSRLGKGVSKSLSSAVETSALKYGSNVTFYTIDNKIATSAESAAYIKINFSNYDFKDWVKTPENSELLKKMFKEKVDGKAIPNNDLIRNIILKQEKLALVADDLASKTQPLSQKIMNTKGGINDFPGGYAATLRELRKDLRQLGLKSRENSKSFSGIKPKEKLVKVPNNSESIFSSSYLHNNQKIDFNTTLTQQSSLLDFKKKLLKPQDYSRAELIENIYNLERRVSDSRLSIKKVQENNEKAIQLLEELRLDGDSIKDSVKYINTTGERYQYPTGNKVILSNKDKTFEIRDILKKENVSDLRGEKLVDHILEKQYAYKLYLENNSNLLQDVSELTAKAKIDITKAEKLESLNTIEDIKLLSQKLEDVQSNKIDQFSSQAKFLLLENKHNFIEKKIKSKLEIARSEIISLDTKSNLEKEALWGKKQKEILNSFDDDFNNLAEDFSQYLNKNGLNNKLNQDQYPAYIQLTSSSDSLYESVRLIERMKDKFDISNLTFDFKSNMINQRAGFSDPKQMRVDIGIQGLKDIIFKDEATNLLRHEFKHAGFAKLKKLNIDSIYHAKYYSLNDVPLDATSKSGYSNRFSAEELYNFTSAPLWSSNNFGNLNKISKSALAQDIRTINYALDSTEKIATQTIELSTKTIAHLEQMKIQAKTKILDLNFLDENFSITTNPKSVKEIKINNLKDSFIYKDFVGTSENKSLISRILKKGNKSDKVELLDQLIKKQNTLLTMTKSEASLRLEAKSMTELFISKLDAQPNYLSTSDAKLELKSLRIKYKELANKVRVEHKTLKAQAQVIAPKKKSFLQRLFN